MQVLDRRDEFAKLGVQIVAVSMCAPRVLKSYLERKPCPVPVVCDPERTAYKAMGLGKISVRRLFHPLVIWRFLMLVLRGHKVRPIQETEDALQAGGDFLIRPDRTLVYAHQGKDPTDRPSVQELLAAIHTHLVDRHAENSY